MAAVVEIAFDTSGQVNVGQGGVPITGHAAVAGIARIGIQRLAGAVLRVLELTADRERDVIDAQVRHAQGDLLRLRQGIAALDGFLGKEAHANGKVLAHPPAHLAEDLTEHGQAPFKGMAAITVLARITAGQERGQGIGMGRMQLHPVIARLPRAQGSQAEIMDDAVDIRLLQHIDGLPPARAGHLHEMNDLRHRLAVGGVMHPLRQFAVARDESVVGQTQQRPGFCPVYRRCLDHDQADPALGIAYIAVHDVAVDQPVLARQPGDHGRYHDPVRQDHAVDVQGL